MSDTVTIEATVREIRDGWVVLRSRHSSDISLRLEDLALPVEKGDARTLARHLYETVEVRIGPARSEGDRALDEVTSEVHDSLLAENARNREEAGLLRWERDHARKENERLQEEARDLRGEVQAQRDRLDAAERELEHRESWLRKLSEDSEREMGDLASTLDHKRARCASLARELDACRDSVHHLTDERDEAREGRPAIPNGLHFRLCQLTYRWRHWGNRFRSLRCADELADLLRSYEAGEERDGGIVEALEALAAKWWESGCEAGMQSMSMPLVTASEDRAAHIERGRTLGEVATELRDTLRTHGEGT